MGGAGQHSLRALACILRRVQTVDLPLLCTHCGEILGNSVACGPPSRPAGLGNGIDSSQEALVVQYLASVGAVGDDIDEDRMAALVEEHSILANMCAPLACAVAVACPGAEARWSP